MHLTISTPSDDPRRDSIGSRPTYVFDNGMMMFADLRSHALCHRRADTRLALRSFVLVDAGQLTEWSKSRRRRTIERSPRGHRPFPRTAPAASVVRLVAGRVATILRSLPALAPGRRERSSVLLRSCSGHRSACQGPRALISVIFDRTGPGGPGTRLFRPGWWRRIAKRVTHRTTSTPSRTAKGAPKPLRETT